MKKIQLLIVEDNERLRAALGPGLTETGRIEVVGNVASGEEAVVFCQKEAAPDAVLMDVALAGKMNGVRAAVEIRREHPRLPVVFYSIQDEDSYDRRCCLWPKLY